MTFCCLFQQTVHFPDAFILVLAGITQRTDGIHERLLVCGRQADLRPIVLPKFLCPVPKSAAVFVFQSVISVNVDSTNLRCLAESFLVQISLSITTLGIMPLSTTVIDLVTVKNFEPPITMIELRTASIVPRCSAGSTSV